MYSWVKPKCLIPVHGEPRHLREQARLGHAAGIKQTLIPHNGSLIRFEEDGPQIIDTLQAGYCGYDGNRLVHLSSEMLKDRGRMSAQGAIFVTLMIDSYGQLTQKPQFSFCGICEDSFEENDLKQALGDRLRDILLRDHKNTQAQKDAVAQLIRYTAGKQLGKKPMVRVHLIESK